MFLIEKRNEMENATLSFNRKTGTAEFFNYMYLLDVYGWILQSYYIATSLLVQNIYLSFLTILAAVKPLKLPLRSI